MGQRTGVRIPPGAGGTGTVEAAGVWVLAAAAAAGGALAGCHPTGTPVLDPAYAALLAAAATLAASRAGRAAVLVLAAVAAAMTRGSWLVVPAAAALMVAFASVFPRRARPLAGAVAGALAVQVVLRWPAAGFQGLTALVAAAAVAPCMVAGCLAARPWLRRWLLRAALAAGALVVVFSVPVAVAALLAHGQVSAGIQATEGALGSVTSGGASTGTPQLRAASADFAVAARRTGAWWTAGGRLVPIVAQQRQALARATSVARSVTALAASEASGVKLSALTYHDGGIDLGRLRALDGPLDTVDSRLGAAARQLASLRSGWLLSPVRSRLGLLDTQITSAHVKASLADQVVRAAPGLLGGDGTRHYFLAFMTPAESRGLDGFIGAYGELSADQGRIRLIRSGYIGDLNKAPPGARHLTGPADYLARYGSFAPQDHFQDLTYSPDMPTVADVIAQLYPQSGGDRIDGVLALDPYALASLLQFTGPVQVPGLGQLTSANAAGVLLKGQYAELPAGGQQGLRHDYLKGALAAAFSRLSSGSLPGPQAIASALDPEVRQGRLLLWSTHRSEQPVLRRVGLAGAFPAAAGGDLLAVTTQNAANNKIDAYLQRSIRDEVSYDPATGAVRSRVTITLHNRAPASGLSSEVIGSYPGSGLPAGTNRTWLSIYSPLRLTAAALAGRPLAMPGTPELGVRAYSAYVDIPAGATVSLTATLSGLTTPDGAYRLSWRTQPMVIDDHDGVQVTTPPGWVVAGSSRWSPPAAGSQTHAFAIRR